MTDLEIIALANRAESEPENLTSEEIQELGLAILPEFVVNVEFNGN